MTKRGKFDQQYLEPPVGMKKSLLDGMYCNVDKLCPCGSGEQSWWLCDARGIEVGRVCCKCEEEKRKHYREEIFTDPGYEADEPIEEE